MRSRSILPASECDIIRQFRLRPLHNRSGRTMSETFGRYTVVGQLGRGAMGVVYLASDPMLNRQVAVKTVDLAVDDPQEREFLRNGLLRDARAAAVLKHPNIVSVHDVFEDGGRAYVVMEYVEGDSLSARLKANPLPEAAVLLQVL